MMPDANGKQRRALFSHNALVQALKSADEEGEDNFPQGRGKRRIDAQVYDSSEEVCEVVG